MDTSTPLDERIATVRRFNRFYTRAIGALGQGLQGGPFPLTEARVLWELAHHAPLTATELRRELRLDAGYMSRLLRSLRERGLVKAQVPKPAGGHQDPPSPPKGRGACAPVDKRSHEQTAELLARLDDERQQGLVEAMRRIEGALDEQGAPAPLRLRPPRPGDMGWVVQRHGELYAREYGWDWRFEALVARICADFVDHFKPEREACWIAEQAGRRVGCVFVVQAAPTIAQLRMLVVEPDTRGQGIGAALVAECERFAREKGYRKMRLWTNSILLSARRIYEKAGYELVKTERHQSFGHELVGETWELKL